MNDLGFIKIASAIPEIKVADCAFNGQKIIDLIIKAQTQQVQIVCFPELCVTGYTCGDLFFQQALLEQAILTTQNILEATKELDITFIIGAPVQHDGKLFNTAIVCYKGQIMGYVPKTYLPNYNEFYEKRWFVSSSESANDYIGEVPFGTNILFGEGSRQFAIEICEDLWTIIPPSCYHAQHGAAIIFNLSASNELINKHAYRKALIQQQSARCIAGYVYVSSGWGESTTDTVYTGNAIISENGSILAEAKRFSFEEQLIVSEIDIDRIVADRRKNTSFGIGETAKLPYRIQKIPNLFADKEHKLTRKVNPLPFTPPKDSPNEHCEEIFSIQTGGLAKRVIHTQTQQLILGISGGLDSTLALLVCVKTFEKLNIPNKNIIGVTMPGFGTSNRTYSNAIGLMQALGVTIREINIVKACEQHFEDINHNPDIHDITYENTQARERTQILMDIANQEHGLVIGTGDMSELALGWATYNGDHMSMYAINSGIPKTLIKHLVSWVAKTQIDPISEKILLDIVDTPVSPELLPTNSNGDISQKTEDVVGPYELHDFFLYYAIRFGFSPVKIYYLARHAFDTIDKNILLKWLEVFFRRFFSQQFKRSCMPDGPKIGSINLSPRGDWRMPSDASATLWLAEIENLKQGM